MTEKTCIFCTLPESHLADAELQPIRGYPLGMDIAIGVVEQMAIREG
jgi:hypothetical protein